LIQSLSIRYADELGWNRLPDVGESLKCNSLWIGYTIVVQPRSFDLELYDDRCDDVRCQLRVTDFKILIDLTGWRRLGVFRSLRQPGDDYINGDVTARRLHLKTSDCDVLGLHLQFNGAASVHCGSLLFGSYDYNSCGRRVVR
jgi:hypothetical protein